MDQYEDNRRIRHDIAHHMHTIQLLLESDRRQEATAYAGELMRQQEHSSQLGQCENPLVDAFLFSRIREARQAGIRWRHRWCCPGGCPLPTWTW